MRERNKYWAMFSILVVVCSMTLYIKSARGEQFILSSIFLLTLGLSGIAVCLYTIYHTKHRYGSLMLVTVLLVMVGSIFSIIFSFYEIPFERIMQRYFLKIYYFLLAIAFLRATIADALLEWKDRYFKG
jgi:hypothetical protein